jgi:MFS family permease
MGIGCFITIIASFVQAFAPYHKVGVFILGRVLIGIGQGIALSELKISIAIISCLY